MAHDLGFRVRVEKPASRKQLPKHDRRREEIRSTIGTTTKLLGRHVRELAFDAATLTRGLKPSRGFRHTEVSEARDTIGADENGLRPDVAMNGIERTTIRIFRFVRGVETVENARHDRRDDRKGRDLSVRHADEARERQPMHVLHHQHQLMVVLDNIERAHDVWMTNLRGDPSFVEEHVRRLGIVRRRGVHHLDGDDTCEAGLSEHATEVHGSHAAGGDGLTKEVATDRARHTGGLSEA